MHEKRKSILDGALEAFFKAILDGYLGNCAKSKKNKTSNGLTTITFHYGDYTVIDSYRTTPLSEFSSGETVILYKGDMIWQMFYSGRYPKIVIPFLKFALGEAYKANKFHGGRGKEHLIGKGIHKEFLYLNFFSGHFSSFEGKESIRSVKTGETLGFHKYFGMSML